MKRKSFVLTISTLLVAGAVSFAIAETPAVGGEAPAALTAPQPGAGFKRNFEQRQAVMAAALGLTDAQQSQIKSIVVAARQANAPLRQRLADDRKKIKELSAAIPFNETAVREVMANSESVRADLAIARIKVKNEIQAILTPEQQAKAKQMRQQRSHGMRGSGI